MANTMNTPGGQGRVQGLSLAIALAIGVAGMATIFIPRPAQAFAIVCTNCSNWMTQIPEYAAKIAHYKKQVDAMKAQIASIQNMFLSLGIQPGPEMDEVPDNYRVAERCGGFSLSSLSTVLNINGSGDIYEQQKQVCANIQMMQNIKYNHTVKFLRESYYEMRKDFDALQQKQKSARTQGDAIVAAQDADSVFYKQEARYKDWQSKMQAYDSYIAIMQENQKLLAQMALKGTKTGKLLGQIGKTAILEAALN